MNYIPQGAMHRMRAGFADGAPVRNRSFEQQFTRSGNPNMPIFNNARQQMPNNSFRQIDVAQGYGSRPERQNAIGTPNVGYLPQLMGSQRLSKPAQSFHRPPMGRLQGGSMPRQAVMPVMATPQPAAQQGVWSNWFGRYLPIRERG